MTLFPTQNRRMSSAMLAVLMTVASLGVTVTHTHAMGSVAHVHGYAWNASGSDVVSSGENGCTTETHSHRILFGVEFPAEIPSDQVSPTPDQCVTATSYTNDCDCPTFVDWNWLVMPVTMPILEMVFEPIESRTLIPSQHDTLTPFALHAVPGVLNT